MANVLIIKNANFVSSSFKTVSIVDDGKKNIFVVANPSIGGIITGGGSYDKGQEVNISAVANPGYVFVRWDDGVTSASRIITVGTTNKTYTAIFQIDDEGVEYNSKSLIGYYYLNSEGNTFTNEIDHPTANEYIINRTVLGATSDGHNTPFAAADGVATIIIPNGFAYKISVLKRKQTTDGQNKTGDLIRKDHVSDGTPFTSEDIYRDVEASPEDYPYWGLSISNITTKSDMIARGFSIKLK